MRTVAVLPCRPGAPIDPLFPYQQYGARWLAARRVALLADEPGLGKTAQAIVAADIVNAERILVVCPAVARINWTKEFERFSTLGGSSVALLDGASHTRLHQQRISAVSFDLANRSEINASLRSWLANTSTRASALVIDESHFLKSVDAQRSHAILGRSGLVHAARWTWALSGTPAPNNLAELWPLLRVFGVYAGSYDQFVAQFCTTRHTPYGTAITGHLDIPGFRRLVAPVILRRKVEEVMPDLPKITFADYHVEAGEVDWELAFPEHFILNRMDELNAKIARERALMEGIVSSIGLGDAGIQALGMFEGDKAPSSARRVLGLKKVKPVIELVKTEFESGLDKIVIFAWHKAVIEALRDGLAEYGAVSLYGRSSPGARERAVARFQHPGNRCRVFVGNVLSAGVAITLTAANNILIVEPSTVPGNNVQAVLRVRRIGQTRPVLARFVMLHDDPLDIRIQQAYRRKTKDLVEAFD